MKRPKTYRMCIAAALAVLLSALLATPALAAGFTGTPAVYNTSGAGPFFFGVASSSAREGLYGGVAYKLSTEQHWRRCFLGRVMTMPGGLPEGRYSVEIADDVNMDVAAARGLFGSSITAPCFMQPPPAANPSAQFVFYVDGTPPAIAAPSVTIIERTAFFSAQVDDEVSGVRSIVWSFGDGVEATTRASSAAHAYRSVGTYTASVTASDAAGNYATKTVAVTIPPLPSSIARPPAAATLGASAKPSTAACTTALRKRNSLTRSLRRTRSKLARAKTARGKRTQRRVLRSRYRQLRSARMRVNAIC